jgi:hypothetical protein
MRHWHRVRIDDLSTKLGNYAKTKIESPGACAVLWNEKMRASIDAKDLNGDWMKGFFTDINTIPDAKTLLVPDFMCTLGIPWIVVIKDTRLATTQDLYPLGALGGFHHQISGQTYVVVTKAHASLEHGDINKLLQAKDKRLVAAKFRSCTMVDVIVKPDTTMWLAPGHIPVVGHNESTPTSTTTFLWLPWISSHFYKHADIKRKLEFSRDVSALAKGLAAQPAYKTLAGIDAFFAKAGLSLAPEATASVDAA